MCPEFCCNSLLQHNNPSAVFAGRTLADTVIFGIRSAFDKLRSVREMEYELDFVTNRANRDMQVGSPTVVFCCMHTLIEPDMSCHSGRRLRVLTSVYLKREQQSNM